MSTYIYCPRPSQGALELVGALGAQRLRRFDGLDFWKRKSRVSLEAGDAIICWGAGLPEFEGVRVLNSGPKMTKLRELELLAPVVPVPTHYAISYAAQVKKYGQGTFLERVFNHSGGEDLLNPPPNPDYLVLKCSFVREYRLHVFGGRSIRAGQKQIREGFREVPEGEVWRPDVNLAHPWIRSFDAGWRVNYDGFLSTKKLRDLAKRSVEALNLTFGAVDIGETATGALMVLEVNRAPGIEGNSVTAYARTITKWLTQNEVHDDSRGDEAAEPE